MSMGCTGSGSSASRWEFDRQLRVHLRTEGLRPSLSTLSLHCAYSHEHYQKIARELEQIGEYKRRREVEESLLTDENEFTVAGYCCLTSRYTDFTVTLTQLPGAPQRARPNWRETLLSHGVYSNRMRASMHLFELLLRPRKDDAIFITEHHSPLYEWLKRRYRNVTGSEYLGPDVPGGRINEHDIRHESLTALSFPDRSMQFILSFDCFEHFSDYKAGLRECARVLKDGGSLVITVPFRRDSATNIVRARDRDDGTIEHLLPAEFHGDPLRKEGCLCYYHFGWELLDDMKAAGFRDPRACLYWSREFGYLGTEQILLQADK